MVDFCYYYPEDREERSRKYEKDMSWAEKRLVEIYKKNLKEWEEKGIIPENPEFYQESKQKFQDVGIEFDEDGNVINELNDETIEKIYGVFKKLYHIDFDSIYGPDFIAFMKEPLFRELKGNPKYLSAFIEELLTTFSY